MARLARGERLALLPVRERPQVEQHAAGERAVHGHRRKQRPRGCPAPPRVPREHARHFRLNVLTSEWQLCEETQKSQSSSSVTTALPITYDEPEPEKKSWFSSAFGERAARIAGFTSVTVFGNIGS